jgi:D-xylose reductase
LAPLLEHPIIQEIAAKHHCDTTAQVLLKWAVQRNIAVIPKSSKVERMKLNVNLDTFNLDKDDMDVIETMEANARYSDFLEEIYGIDLPIFE